MLDREELTHRHDGCSNRQTCSKDENKCCYLVKGHCIIGESE